MSRKRILASKDITTQATALVLEDSVSQFQIISRMIERFGWSTVHCQTLREAAESVKLLKFRCLFLDVFVGAHNSLGHIQRFRKLVPDIPIVVMTAGSSQEAIEETLTAARRAKADHVLRKPFTADDIGTILGTLYADRQATRRRRHLLVIDDSPAVRTLACGIMEFGGYRVSAAATVEEALHKIDIAHVDLILCDLFMPGMGGFKGIRVIKRAWPQVKIIAMSAGLGDGVTSEQTLEKAVHAGADARIQKPFDAEELIALASTVLLDPVLL